MPLSHGKSKKSFQHNIKAELAAGKPLKQSLAIAYNTKRHAQHKAHGGSVKPSRFHHLEGEVDHIMHQKEDGFTDLSRNLAEGGMIHEDEMKSGYMAHPDAAEKHNHPAMMEDDKDLNQHMVHAVMGEPEGHEVDKEMHEQSMDYSDLDRLAMGGYAEGDIIGRVMKRHYSMGGRVANDSEPISEEMPNQFDDLVLRDDLTSHYGDDDNSGDALSDHRENMDREDIIARIMKRRGKQHNPVPA
jgi:hypothetical protein